MTMVDIQGLEDFLGIWTLRLPGRMQGITAIQMDPQDRRADAGNGERGAPEDPIRRAIISLTK